MPRGVRGGVGVPEKLSPEGLCLKDSEKGTGGRKLRGEGHQGENKLKGGSRDKGPVLSFQQLGSRPRGRGGGWGVGEELDALS